MANPQPVIANEAKYTVPEVQWRFIHIRTINPQRVHFTRAARSLRTYADGVETSLVRESYRCRSPAMTLQYPCSVTFRLFVQALPPFNGAAI